MNKPIVQAVLFILVAASWPGQAAADEQSLSLQTGHLEIAIDKTGHLEKLIHKSTGIDYLAREQPAPLCSMKREGRLHPPETMTFDVAAKTITLSFSGCAVSARIGFRATPTHVVFTVKAIDPEKEVELILWGPYPTTIGKTIGETVGVVQDDDFALGIQALNPKTLGGYPSREDDVMPMYSIFEGSDYSDIAADRKDKQLYRGDTARRRKFGSVLQAYCRNRQSDRVIPNWNHDRYLAPAFDDNGVIGSSIALFGCPPREALDTIGAIELAEGLPHPEIDGVWGKKSPGSTASYLIIGFGEETIDEAIALTKRAGLRYLYHGGPFETWGHFVLNRKSFPGGWAGMKRCVDRARKEGISLGLHTLSNFITTNDRYVTPFPHEGLARVGTARLVADVDDSCKEIVVDDPSWFNQMKNNTLRTVVVGEELIRYGSVSAEKPWRLLNCTRGAFGTYAVPHRAGEEIGKLIDHSYKVFLAGRELQEEMAKRIARLFNETGLLQISFDGLEGCWADGMGQYSRTLFAKTWFDNLSDELRGRVINDASNPGHYFWHIYTRMNWGEPWYAGFRESQTQYRLKNQAFYARNLMPAMLGWFNMTPETSLEDAEWLLARAAGFHAGFCLCTSPGVVRQNGMGDAILRAVKEWERARMALAFSKEQKEQLRDIDREFHLEQTSENSWHLFPVHSVKSRQKLKRGPGKKAEASFEFDNPYDEQALAFSFRIEGNDLIGPLHLEIDDGKEAFLLLSLREKKVMRSTGDDTAQVLDSRWKVEAAASVDPGSLLVPPGKHVLKIRGTLSGEGEAILKAELRLMGRAEPVSPR